jgi:hypothetical protein
MVVIFGGVYVLRIRYGSFAEYLWHLETSYRWDTEVILEPFESFQSILRLHFGLRSKSFIISEEVQRVVSGCVCMVFVTDQRPF